METRTLKDKIVCSGAIFYAKSTGRILFLQKAQGKHKGSWGLVGGTNNEGETAWQGLQREVQEELNLLPTIIKTVPLETFVSNDSVFNFHTYLCVVEDEFLPKLSDEHVGYAWCSIDNAPKPLHQGLKTSFGNRTIRNKLETIFELIRFI